MTEAFDRIDEATRAFDSVGRSAEALDRVAPSVTPHPPHTTPPPTKPEAPAPRRQPAPANVREAAINSAFYALGDSALTHDGWLRPRVWELADQIAAYIRDGARPDRAATVCTCGQAAPPVLELDPDCPEHGSRLEAS